MENIKCGYPEKEFSFTGEWLAQSIGSPNTARRNRVTVWLPEFQADDGEKIYPAWLQSTTQPNKANQGDGIDPAS
jgi:hypothetical protein